MNEDGAYYTYSNTAVRNTMYTREVHEPGVGTDSLGWLVDFRAQIPWSEPPRMAVKMGGWVCKISHFQDILQFLGSACTIFARALAHP